MRARTRQNLPLFPISVSPIAAHSLVFTLLPLAHTPTLLFFLENLPCFFENLPRFFENLPCFFENLPRFPENLPCIRAPPMLFRRFPTDSRKDLRFLLMVSSFFFHCKRPENHFLIVLASRNLLSRR